jgi:hypothetical protein
MHEFMQHHIPEERNSKPQRCENIKILIPEATVCVCVSSVTEKY